MRLRKISWWNQHLPSREQSFRKYLKTEQISRPPDERDKVTLLTVQASRLRLTDSDEFQPVHGLLLAMAQPGGDWQYGDKVRVEGVMQTPPEEEGFSYYQIYPDPEASLLAGILLGNDNNIPQVVQEAFRGTGTAHIIAISGFNTLLFLGS